MCCDLLIPPFFQKPTCAEDPNLTIFVISLHFKIFVKLLTPNWWQPGSCPVQWKLN